MGNLIVCSMAMRTEGGDGARWPWLLSRPDRVLRCPDGRVMGAMVTSTESVVVGHCGRPLAILVGSYPR